MVRASFMSLVAVVIATGLLAGCERAPRPERLGEGAAINLPAEPFLATGCVRNGNQPQRSMT
jgi:hypothetical protein